MTTPTKCNHHLGDAGTIFPRAQANSVYRCASCGEYIREYLSLGPATITPDVAIEIRAAELASMVGHWGAMNADERSGWLEHEYPRMLTEQPDDNRDSAAGWLAREIAVTP